MLRHSQDAGCQHLVLDLEGVGLGSAEEFQGS